MSQVQKEVNDMVVSIKEQVQENQELKTTFEKTQREIEGFKKSTNFRLNLYQSKEQKQITEFFSKFLNSSNSDALLVAELGPMKDLISKLREENAILKKQVEMNPLALEKHTEVIALRTQVKNLESAFDPDGHLKSSSMLAKLNSLEQVQGQINTVMLNILEKIQAEKVEDQGTVKDKDGDAQMSSDNLENIFSNSKGYIKSLSKHSKMVDLAELKLKYEQQLEDKNQRIANLETKNQKYLEIIAMTSDKMEVPKPECNMQEPNGGLPAEMLKEYIDIIEQSQKENEQLTKKMQFYQSEIAQLREENHSIQALADQQNRESIMVTNTQVVSHEEMDQLNTQIQGLAQQVKGLSDENEEMLSKLVKHN